MNNPDNCSNRQLNYLLTLNKVLEYLEPLKEVISRLKEPFFVQLTSTLDNDRFEDVKTLLRKTIQDGAYPASGQLGVTQRCFAIKPEVNGLLDLVRKLYSERINDLRG